MPPAAKNPFEKGFLDLPKLLHRLSWNRDFLRVSSWLKLTGGSRLKWGIEFKSKKMYTVTVTQYITMKIRWFWFVSVAGFDRLGEIGGKQL
jgi:hypothetical protein